MTAVAHLHICTCLLGSQEDRLHYARIFCADADSPMQTHAASIGKSPYAEARCREKDGVAILAGEPAPVDTVFSGPLGGGVGKQFLCLFV